jgi:hypothetical protein
MTLTDRIFTHWKSTTQSLLTATIGLSAVAPQISWLQPKHAAWLASAGVVGKVFLGMMQQDAGTTIAETRDGVKAVDSHEVPNDPSAIAVKEN